MGQHSAGDHKLDPSKKAYVLDIETVNVLKFYIRIDKSSFSSITCTIPRSKQEKRGKVRSNIGGAGCLALLILFGIVELLRSLDVYPAMELQSRKRPRPVVSCLRCREKKLKCDRVAPCQNCVRGGFEAQCTYHQQPESVDPHSQPKPKRVQLAEANEPDPRTQSAMGPSIGIIEDLQRRVQKLESLHAVRPHANNFGPIRDASVQNSW